MSGPSKSASHANLVEAVDRLYEVFSCEVPTVIEGCPCCIDTRNTDVLLSIPLRELSGDQLWRYITGAYLTVGGDRDFRYLLPRIFELSSLEPFEVPDTEIVLDKLVRAGWQSWHPAERSAILKFVDAWYDYALEQDMSHRTGDLVGDQAESLLCGLAYAEIDLGDYLRQLALPNYSCILDDLRQRNPAYLSAFWENVPAAYSEFTSFLDEST